MASDAATGIVVKYRPRAGTYYPERELTDDIDAAIRAERDAC